jgi:hypothetical protein
MPTTTDKPIRIPSENELEEALHALAEGQAAIERVLWDVTRLEPVPIRTSSPPCTLAT